MEKLILRIVMTGALGIIIALFVGVGINTFYPEPVYPQELNTMFSAEPTEEETKRYNELSEQFSQDVKSYNTIASLVTVIIAAGVLVVGLLVRKKNLVVSNGVLLGGLFLVIYGSLRGIDSDNQVVSFIAIGIGLISVIAVTLKLFRT